MFCEKCGNKLSDGSKFCDVCGAPVNAPAQPVAPAQPAAPVQPAAPAQPEAPAQPQAPAQPVAPAQPQTLAQPVAPKEKKPLPKWLIPTGIGAGVLAIALIVLFAVVLPMLNKVDLQNYAKLELDEDTTYVDGHAEIVAGIDFEKIYNDKFNPNGDKEEDSEDYDNFDYSDFSKSLDLMNKEDALEDVSDYVALRAAIKGGDKESDLKDPDYGYTRDRVEDVKSSDTILVAIYWEKTPEATRKIAEAEKTLGFTFDKTDKTFEIKVSDALKENNIEFVKPVETDPLGYIIDKKLYNIDGLKDGSRKFKFTETEFEQNGYKFKLESYGGLSVDDKNGDYVGYCSVSASDTYYLSNGDTITLELSEDSLNNGLLVFKKQTADITVEGATPITADEVKEHKTEIEKLAIDKYKDYYSFTDEPTVDSIYLANAVSDRASSTNVVYVILKRTTKDSTGKNDVTKYYPVRICNAFISNGEVNCSVVVADAFSTGNDMDYIQKYSILASKYYTNEKIQ